MTKEEPDQYILKRKKKKRRIFLAVLLSITGSDDEAKPLYERALAINEDTFGPDHLSVAISLNFQAGLLFRKGDYDEAKPLFEQLSHKT